MWVISFFSDTNNLPATGLSPLVKIRDLSDNSLIVDEASMSEVGDGFYKYDFTLYDSTKDYAIRCDSVTISGAGRYTYSGSGVYNTELDEIQTTLSGVASTTTSTYNTVSSMESTLSAVDVRVELVKKIMVNKLVLSDGASGNWVLYDDDDTTPLLTWSVADKSGGAIAQYANTPSRRTRGT